jgi:hypothetical protein
LVADKSICVVFGGPPFNFEKLLEVFEKIHLLSIGLRIIFDMLLMSLEIFNYVLLLSKLCIEEL